MCLDSPANSEGKSRTSAAKAEYRSTIYGTAEAVPFQDQLSRQVYGAAEAVHFQDQLSRQVYGTAEAVHFQDPALTPALRRG